MSDHEEDEENVMDLESEDDRDSDEEGSDEDTDDDAIVYGASTLDTGTGVLTYRGGFISPEINKDLITSVIFADDVELVDEGYLVGADSEGVFSLCLLLVTVQINSACTIIGSYSFKWCRSLVSVHMPLGCCVEIRTKAFSETGLISLNIPASCTFVAEGAFFSCESLVTIEFAESCSARLSESSFEFCTALTTVILPSLTSIAAYSFGGCTALITLTIPETCRDIDDFAFSGDTSMTSIYISEACERIGHWSFFNCRSLRALKLPDSCTDVNVAAFEYCVLLEAAALKMNITVEQLLRYKYRLPKFIIPSFIAFNRCDMLKARTGSDGIGLNEDRDMMVLMYRKIETADLWRKILGYVRPTDV